MQCCSFETQFPKRNLTPKDQNQKSGSGGFCDVRRCPPDPPGPPWKTRGTELLPAGALPRARRCLRLLLHPAAACPARLRGRRVPHSSLFPFLPFLFRSQLPRVQRLRSTAPAHMSWERPSLYRNRRRHPRFPHAGFVPSFGSRIRPEVYKLIFFFSPWLHKGLTQSSPSS